MTYKKLFHRLIDEGMKESDLRKRANISAPTLAKLKNGENITTEVLFRICNAMGCEPSDIVECIRELQVGQIYEISNDESEYGIVVKVYNDIKNHVDIFPLYPNSATSMPHVVLKAKDTNLPNDFIVKCDHAYKETISNYCKYFSTLSTEYLKLISDCILKQKEIMNNLDTLDINN